MAYPAVLSLMQILQQLMDPGRFVLYEKQQIESLQEKVSFLHDFLENYSVPTSKTIQNLEIKIRDTAYRAEDIVESYVSTFILGGRNRIGRFRTFCLGLDTMIEETHSIQQEVVKVKRIIDQINVKQRNHLPTNGSTLTFSDKIPPMVGLVEDSIKLKDWLTSSSTKREVISIVGMGGIGKTTFAKNLFDDSLIVCKFDVRAWVTVSQEYHIREILAGLLDSTIKLSPEMGKPSCEDLAERLYKSLKGRTYLIVMDDIWDTKVWDEVNRFFPDDRNGSRILLTTRLKNVGDHAASFDGLHNMSLLSYSESWNLFCEKVFGGECCPPCLEGIGQEIIRNCRGLPLSIVVIGGLLLMDKTVSYWETIATTLNSSILSTDGGLCSTILSLSYNHLPARLKPCFLYFANFPEDYYIRRSQLIKLWIAEGFIKPNESKSLEDIAEECLEDLSNRSLAMVLKLGHDGKAKIYRVHDILRDFCITKVQKEKFLHVTNRYTLSHPEGIRSKRRISIQPETYEFIKYISNSNGPPLPTRSLLLYDRDAGIIISERSFGLLRVLDMGSGKRLPTFPMEVVRLVHLRYLSLWCLEAIVPASISSIWGLQTLVMDVWDISHLLLEVWTMPHLRHLQVRNVNCHLPDPPHSGVEGKKFVILTNLQTLCTIRNFRFTDEIITRIPKLKKLKVLYDKKFNWSHFRLSNIVCLNELETLRISSSSQRPSPANFKFPVALKKLTLVCCQLHWEDLTVVGSLPNLEVLKLRYSACYGEVWEPNEGEFRELKFLELYSLGLVEWRADDSHFPKLRRLKICGCTNLKDIPIEIGNISTLEMIELMGVRETAYASAELILDQQRSFGNDVLQVCTNE